MTVTGVVPILLVRDVSASACWFEERLGFAVDFLHGEPPFYGSVSRDGVRMHLRFVHEPVFAIAAAREESLIAASFEVSDVRALFEEVVTRGAKIAQPLTSHEWGGMDFHVRDADGNAVSFVSYEMPMDIDRLRALLAEGEASGIGPWEGSEAIIAKARRRAGLE